MPQRRPPDFSLPQGIIWKRAAYNAPLNSAPLGVARPSGRYGDRYAEWAYVTPMQPDGVPGSRLVDLPREQQDDIVRFWFLSNYEPLGPGPWAAWDMPGAGWGEGRWAPETWPAATLVNEEFGDWLPVEVRSTIATELHALAAAWCVIQDQVLTDLWEHDEPNAPDRPTLVKELLERLDRLERLQRESAEVRHGIGGNQGPPLVDLLEPIETARQALAEGGPDGVAKASGVLALFRSYLPDLGKGAAKAIVGLLATGTIPYIKPTAVWIFTEVVRIAALLGQWISLSSLN